MPRLKFAWWFLLLFLNFICTSTRTPKAVAFLSGICNCTVPHIIKGFCTLFKPNDPYAWLQVLGWRWCLNFGSQGIRDQFDKCCVMDMTLLYMRFFFFQTPTSWLKVPKGRSVPPGINMIPDAVICTLSIFSFPPPFSLSSECLTCFSILSLGFLKVKHRKHIP